MPATLTASREAARAAIWYVFEGALIVAALANTSGATPPASASSNLSDWFPYLLAGSFDLFLTAGSSSYNSTNVLLAQLQQLSFQLSYSQSVTYTDIVIFAIPVQRPAVAAGQPTYLSPFVGVIHESSPITLNTGQTKTYRLDLTAKWL